MSDVQPTSKKRRNVFIALGVIALFVGGFYAAGAVFSIANSNPCPSGFQFLPSGITAGTGMCARVTVVIHEQQATYVNLGMLSQGYSASCYVFCNGITYTLDPTVIITSAGHSFEQCKVFGSTTDITCTTTDFATYIGISESTSVPTTSDYSGSGPCKTTSPSNELTTGGLADVVGIVSPGVTSSTVTTTITNTFTAAETDSLVQVACLQTEVASGANTLIYAEGTFGVDSLSSGNTIAITWAIARA